MKRIKQILARFRKDEEGSIAIETVLILPILFWTYLSMFAIFDAYRQYSLNQKAAFTIGDVISRETTPLDQAYMAGTRDFLAYLTVNDTADVSVRVTSVRYDANRDEYRRDWSQSNGWVPALTGTAVAALKDNLPIMPHNERVTVVETFVRYNPPFDTGLMNRDIHNFVFTRPRYAPRVLWSDN
jgi:Flp pilus assembly protein TadG